LYEAGNDGAVSGIDYGIGSLSTTADLTDASVTDENVATNDAVLRIHRHDCPVPDED
jgi:hypothetical protein